VWRPELSPRTVARALILTGVMYLIFGATILAASNQVVELGVQYGGPRLERSIFSIGAHWTYEPCPLGQQCQLSFQVPPEGMVAPVFVFYQLSEVYQNYLRYTTSKNDAQLSGQADVVPDPNRDCKTDYVSVSTANNETKSYLPCGLQAHSLFNDSYALDSTLAFISDTGIAWDTDLRTKFHNPPEFPELCDNGTTICLSSEYPTVFAAGNDGVRNEHFVVWMRLAALPTFRKLYGRIDTDIPGGVNLTINVTSHFPVDSFGGSKALILSTASWTGGRNLFLGTAFIVSGAVFLGLGLLIISKEYFFPRQLGREGDLETPLVMRARQYRQDDRGTSRHSRYEPLPDEGDDKPTDDETSSTHASTNASMFGQAVD